LSLPGGNQAVIGRTIPVPPGRPAVPAD